MDTDCLCSALPFQRLCRVNILGDRDGISLGIEPSYGQKRPEITPDHISSLHQDEPLQLRGKGRHGHCPLYEIQIP